MILSQSCMLRPFRQGPERAKVRGELPPCVETLLDTVSVRPSPRNAGHGDPVSPAALGWASYPGVLRSQSNNSSLRLRFQKWFECTLPQILPVPRELVIKISLPYFGSPLLRLVSIG